MGIDDDTARLIPLCYHQSKQRVGEVGEALAKEQGIRFLNIYSCNEADWEAFSSFPDDHPLNSPD